MHREPDLEQAEKGRHAERQDQQWQDTGVARSVDHAPTGFARFDACRAGAGMAVSMTTASTT